MLTIRLHENFSFVGFWIFYEFGGVDMVTGSQLINMDIKPLPYGKEV